MFTILPHERLLYFRYVHQHIEHDVLLLLHCHGISTLTTGLATLPLEEEELWFLVGLVLIVPRELIMQSGNIVGIVHRPDI